MWKGAEHPGTPVYLCLLSRLKSELKIVGEGGVDAHMGHLPPANKANYSIQTGASQPLTNRRELVYESDSALVLYFQK